MFPGLRGYRPGYEYDVHKFLMYILQQVNADAQYVDDLYLTCFIACTVYLSSWDAWELMAVPAFS